MFHNSISVLTYAGAAALAATAIGFAPTAATPQAVAQQAGITLDEAVTALRGISTMKADFIQTDRNGHRVSGVLTLKRPGRIRFEYEKSVNMLIVADGKSLNFIDYDVQQRQRWPIKNSPLGALLDPNRDVSRYGKLMPTSDPGIASVEVRDKKHPEYGIITLIFVRKASAPGGLELVSWVALDSQNQRTTIRLTNQRYGVPVSDNAFRWKNPKPRTRR
jgi:outer membrane lipoprotein-sorting protein